MSEQKATEARDSGDQPQGALHRDETRRTADSHSEAALPRACAAPKDIRLFAFDLDGTVLAPDKTVTPRTQAALRALMARGVEVVPATGRTWHGLCENVLRMDDFRYVVAGAGSEVLDRKAGEFLCRKNIPAEVGAALVRRLLKPGITVYLTLDDERGTRVGTCVSREEYERIHAGATYWDDPPVDYDVAEMVERRGIGLVKVGLHYLAPWCDEDFYAMGREYGIAYASSGWQNVEFNATGTSKAEGLRLLAERLGFGMENVCAIGDSGNDAAMLQAAGLGVAMGNSTPDALEVADVRLTLTNAKDGLADFVERELLGRA